jgi:hypothetical protein
MGHSWLLNKKPSEVGKLCCKFSFVNRLHIEHPQWCLVCDAAQIFLTSKFSYLPFSKPTHKSKSGVANRVDITCTNDCDCAMTNREQLSDHIYYTLLLQMSGFAVPFTSLSKLYKSAGPKLLCWSKLAWFDFSSSNFNVQGHILSTAHGHVHFTYCSYSHLYISIYTTKIYHMPKQIIFWYVHDKKINPRFLWQIPVRYVGKNIGRPLF